MSIITINAFDASDKVVPVAFKNVDDYFIIQMQTRDEVNKLFLNGET